MLQRTTVYHLSELQSFWPGKMEEGGFGTQTDDIQGRQCRVPSVKAPGISAQTY